MFQIIREFFFLYSTYQFITKAPLKYIKALLNIRDIKRNMNVYANTMKLKKMPLTF